MMGDFKEASLVQNNTCATQDPHNSAGDMLGQLRENRLYTLKEPYESIQVLIVGLRDPEDA